MDPWSSFDYGGFQYGNGWSNSSNSFDSLSAGIGAIRNNLTGTTANNQFNAAEAAKNRQWQEMMSSTAYQRAKADMDAAGINPASLSSSSGLQPASTPSGASAQASASGASPISAILKAAMFAISKGLAAKLTSAATVAAADKRASVVKNVSQDASKEIAAAKKVAWEAEVQRTLLKNQQREFDLLKR